MPRINCTNLLVLCKDSVTMANFKIIEAIIIRFKEIQAKL